MRKNRRRRWWITAVVVLVVLAGAGTGAYLLLRGGGSSEVTYLTSKVATGTVSDSIDADFTLISSKSDTTISPGASGVVTALYIAEGDRLKSLQKVAVISGQRVFALVSGTPLYEELSQGDTSANVRALEAALKEQGYDHGEVDGYFDTTTEDGLMDWQADNNLDETGTIDLTTFVWVPTDSVVSTVSVTKGSNVTGGLATVSYPRAIMAQASIGQADISTLKKGQQATLTVDGHDDETITATISSIATESASSSSSTMMGGGTTSTTAQYTVGLKIADLPSWALTGMTGSMTVTIKQHADVLVVPTSAVAGNASSPYVRLMSNGKIVNRSIETGMTTASLTEVTNGLTAGETVVTGEVTAAATNTDSTQSPGGSILGGGATTTNGGPPAGFQPPSGGAGGQAGGQ